MKKFMFLMLFVALLCFSCMSNLGRGFKIKTPSKGNSISWDYSSKNYSSAFYSAVAIIKKNKSGEKREEALSIIEPAYSKYLEEEESTMEYLIKTQVEKDYDRSNMENTPTNDTYKRCIRLRENYDDFQKQLKEIGALYYEGRELVFPKKDYSDLIARAKDKYSDFLFTAAKSHTKGLVNSFSQDEKSGYRRAFDIYVMLQDFDNTYKKAEVINLKDEAFRKGQSYIAIQINNQLKQYKGIEQNILNGLKLGRWITIGKDARGKYDYNFLVVIDNFDVSKGDVQRTVFDKEKEIVVQENQTDRDRRPVVVSRGRLLKSRLEIIDLFKEAFMRGTVKKTDNYTKKTKTDIIEASTAFQYSYAIQNGDIRAIDPEYLPLLEMAPMPLPTDGEMMSRGVTKFTGNLESKIISEAFHNN